MLAYPYTKGNSTPKCVGAFIPILEQLLRLHEAGFLEEQKEELEKLEKLEGRPLCHGDIRLANMVFN